MTRVMQSGAAALLALVVTATPGAAQTPPPGTLEFYHVDALGSVRAISNASGQVIATFDYHPFGEGVGTEIGQESMRFTGKSRDAETGLDYFGARHYAPRLGRLSTVDPVMDTITARFDPQKWNRFAYVTNNPLRYVDPDGRERVEIQQRKLVEAYLQGRISRHDLQDHFEAQGKGALLGLGVVSVGAGASLATLGRAALGWLLARPNEAIHLAESILAPPGTPTFSASAAARAFGFLDPDMRGGVAGGALRNGGHAAVNFSQSGSTLSVNISFMHGGSMAALQEGAINAAKAVGAKEVQLMASMPTIATERFLRMNGFTQVGTNLWAKTLRVK